MPHLSSCVYIIIAVASSSCCVAFQVRVSLPSPLLLSQKQQQICSIRLFMSSPSEEEDPTLAALRKKREQILAKKKKEDGDGTPPPQDANNKARIASILSDNNSPNNKATGSILSPPSDTTTTPTQRPKPTTIKSNVPSISEVASSKRQPQKQQSSGGDNNLKFSQQFTLPSDENDLHIPNRIGFGTQCWGDTSRGFTSERKMTKKMAKEGKLFNPGDLMSAYQTLINGGITFVDTSEAYGGELSAEQIIAMCCNDEQSSLSFTNTPILASKYDPRGANNLLRRFLGLASSTVVRAIRSTCDRLECNSIDLYQIDVAQPTLYLGGKQSLASGLAKAVDLGLCNHVGVCNMNARQMKSMFRKLESVGVPLVSNQFEFSLLNRRALFNGQIQACQDLGVTPIAHTPLARGLATGKYTALNPTGGKLGSAKFDFQTLDPLSPIHEAQEVVAGMVRARLLKSFNDDKEMRSRNYKMKKSSDGEFNKQITTTQVAINYVVAKGAVPIPGINNAKEAEELLGCLGWGLTENEVGILEEACDKAEKYRPPTPKKANFFFGARKRNINLGF